MAAYSPDGKRVVTCGWSKTARIWDLASGKEVLAIDTPGDYVFAAAFSPDGKHVVLGGNGDPDLAGIWDAEKGTLVRSLRTERIKVTGQPDVVRGP